MTLCVFFVYKNRSLVVKKNEMTKVDEEKVSVGRLIMKFVAEIFDSDMNDGLCKEVELVEVFVIVMR